MNIVNILKTQSIELPLYDQVLEKLYKCFDHSKTRYEMLKTEEQLQNIKNNNCYISPQFQGVAYILFFCFLDINGTKRKMNILIPKKDLKETREKNKNNEIKMYNLFVPFVDEEYYNKGAILDGKMVKTDNSTHKLEHSFIIHELYYEPLQNTILNEKHDIIKTHFLPKFDKINGCKFIVSRLYEQNQLNNLFDRLSQSKFKIIGMMFLFRTSHTYFVYTDEVGFELLRNGKPLPKHKTFDNSTQEFKMCSTNITDVYQLYDLSDNENIGIAGIPDIETSHYYRQAFKHTTSIKVSCVRSEKFGKWIPIINDCYDHVLDSL